MNYSSLSSVLLALIMLILAEPASAGPPPAGHPLLLLYSGNVLAELGPCG